MLDQGKLKDSLRRNLHWFEASGVMRPDDGSWGVAERVVLTDDNEALEKTKKSFPSFTEHDGHIIIEHRRPDCNFETAWLFLLAMETIGGEKYYRTADNILRYLFCCSGMRNTNYPSYPLNVWRWANEKWIPSVYFDDNSWNCAISIIIGRKHPELNAKYQLRERAVSLAYAMLAAFDQSFQKTPPEDFKWSGNLSSPHWGSLVCMAFAFAYEESGDVAFMEAIRKYHAYLADAKEAFCSSEQAYIVIGSAIAAAKLDDSGIERQARKSADSLISKMDSDGNIPSEWGREAPTGPRLVDTLYTMNWAVVGLLALYETTRDGKYLTALEKAVNLLLKIQDKSPENYLFGCWRGMYDMESERWGGGNRFEGGAASIYTGWTNAPIAIVIATALRGDYRLFA